MKKTIIILFFIPLLLNAQELSDDYSFKKDKFNHALFCNITSAGVFVGVYAKTGDAEVSLNASWMSGFFASLFKEMGDLATKENMSLSDITYGTASSVGTAFLFYSTVKLIEHRKEKKRMQKFKRKKKINGWALNNEFLNNK